MADVIIKDMEMPSSCKSCKLNNDTVCALINGCVYDETDGSTRRPDCPLCPTPEWIGLVLSKYDENKEKPWIRDPVAYTLYEVWKIMDSKVSYGPSERGDGDG